MSRFSRSTTRSPGLRFSLAGAPGTSADVLSAALAQRLAREGFVDVTVGDITARLLDPADAAPPATLPDAMLLLGLDALPISERAAAMPIDTRLRAAIEQAGWPYSVVYGRSGEQRLNAAWSLLRAVLPRLPGDAPPAPTGDGAARLRACCPECLVPECEHRLFGFLKQR